MNLKSEFGTTWRIDTTHFLCCLSTNVHYGLPVIRSTGFSKDKSPNIKTKHETQVYTFFSNSNEVITVSLPIRFHYIREVSIFCLPLHQYHRQSILLSWNVENTFCSSKKFKKDSLCICYVFDLPPYYPIKYKRDVKGLKFLTNISFLQQTTSPFFRL